MRMKKVVGIILMGIGGAVIVGGLLLALSAFAGLYSSTLADPLNAPENSGQSTRASMLRGVYAGIPGAVAFVIGRIILARERRRAMRDDRRAR
jgi:hypothetical protein